MPRWRSLLYALTVGTLAVIAVACAWFEFTPVASVVDTRWIALIAGVVCGALSAVKLFRQRPIRVAWSVPLAAALGATATAVVLIFYTYREERIRFQSDNLQLAGTLYRPRTAGPAPAVVFLHGSGRQTRQEFLYHAKLFARHGIAALTYDKRGSGESQGETYRTDYHGYARDAAAAISYLRSRPDIRANCIGVVGHSEGGWVASLVATDKASDPAFVIVISTTPLSPAQQVVYETGARVRAAGFPSAVVDRAMKLQKRVLEFQRTGSPDEKLGAELRDASGEPWFDHAELPDRLYPIEDYAWWRGVMDFDALTHWKRVGAPVLMISGGRDLNSDVRLSQSTLRRALHDGANPTFRGVIFENMEHGGIEWWLPYRIPPPRFPKGLPDLLIAWSKGQIAECKKSAPSASSSSVNASRTQRH